MPPEAGSTAGLFGLGHAPWQPFAQEAPDDLRWAQDRARAGADGVALLGDARAGAAGRFGIVGVPGQTRVLSPADRLAEIVDDRPRTGLRVLLLGYEFGAALLRLPAQAPPPGQPLGLVMDLEDGLLVDHALRRVATFGAGAEATGRKDAQPEDTRTDDPRAATQDSPSRARLTPLVDDVTHRQRLVAVADHIAAGDIYQANLSRPVAVHGEVNVAHLLGRLHADNPVAHGAWLRHGDFSLVSNSMETLLDVDPTGVARSYPIKGTYRRGQDERGAGPSGGSHVGLDLDPKERAEHVMIVDLVRNDLGRVADVGSVVVEELMGIHGFFGLWHGISRVRARVAPARLGALVESLFPGGSITGCPKRRAVELLRDIEGTPRGVYTGSLGFIAPDGTVRLSILIRTLVQDGRGTTLSVGGGIVADSQPNRELDELDHKLAIFARCLGDERYASVSAGSSRASGEAAPKVAVAASASAG